MQRKKDIFLLAGGPRQRREGPDPLLQLVFAQSPDPGPNIAYIGAASDDDKSFFQFIAKAFQNSGAGRVDQVTTASPGADISRAREIIRSADIIFISGGDVERGMQVLQEKHLLEFLREEFERGKVFFGLSAGSIMLAREWVRWSDPDDDASAELFDCLAMAQVLCDTHAEEDDWAELKTALKLKRAGAIGYGIPTGSALRVGRQRKVTALGGPVRRFVSSRDHTADKAQFFHTDLTPS